jgi:hypothetical protein
MDKTNPPTTFGVFKPVGHTVVTYRASTDVDAATHALLAQGFEQSALVRYTPDEMKAQVAVELVNASPLANFGYEIDLVKVHQSHAEEGCSFLVVHAPDEALAERVASVARQTGAVSGQHYGRFMIEELSGLSSSELG